LQECGEWDSRVSHDEYQHLEMHLERENVWAKAEETIEKLFRKQKKVIRLV
jgi:hypothetical protein